MSLCLSISSNRRSRHSSLNLRVSPYSVIDGFIPVGHANHYMTSLKVGSIAKVDRFEVARSSKMYKIIDHPFLICFISPIIIYEVITVVIGQFQSVQRSDISKETTRVVIHLPIDS
ncbi:hypothetical protein YC2023_089067 [Brassica napus]